MNASGKGLVLFAHGARDPRWAQPFERLAELVRSNVPDTVVALGFLELMTPRLPELVRDMVAQGVGEIAVVPVFLGQGGHVLRDLPVLAEAARAAHPGLVFNVAQAVGEDADVLAAMMAYCVKVAHGNTSAG
ncbi:MAG: sirohydrochlorin chelatase [Janthinobacterium lividum]